MTSREFKDRLTRRARKARVELPTEVFAPFEAYFRLLAQWNVKINLTGLPLQPPTDETFDRLFIEPLVASTLVAESPGVWFDLGSGGGSPALPLKMIRSTLSLTLVESKIRKAAFLREVVRVLGLTGTEVANIRFEELQTKVDGTADLITVRAVRPDTALFDVSARLLKSGGHLLLFGKPSPRLKHPGFEPDTSRTEVSSSIVMGYKRMFHVEQTD